ncbi:hypothetical protein [Nonomuraea sp. C10]|uniref:hypothetical protein n=1 Tax=Nonomuraea sp. C10 TaxID=2600577 RepID=UPI0011CEAE45|nr:hypothetical protein [Nonomuraea sp. C10]TXK41274.1 hypothetical protein FR742_18400 [Nonomuraea sp. C10]
MFESVRLWLVIALGFLTSACALGNNVLWAGAIACLPVIGYTGVRRLRHGSARGTGDVFGALTWTLVGAVALYLGCVLAWPFPTGLVVSLFFLVVAMIIGIRKDVSARYAGD